MPKLQQVKPYIRDSKKLMTVAEFSKEYGIGLNKSYEIVNIKGFPMIRNGKKYLIIRSKVDEFLNNNISLIF